MVVGFDAAIGDRVTVGVSGGNASPSVSLAGTSDQATTRGMLQGAFYGRYAQKRSRFDAVVGLSSYENNTIRMVTDGVAKVNARATYQTRSLAAHFEYGYTFLGRTVDIAPYAGAQLGRLRVDGFEETGAGVLGLTASDRDVFSRRLLAGSTVANFKTGFGALRIEGAPRGRTSSRWSPIFRCSSRATRGPAGSIWRFPISSATAPSWARCARYPRKFPVLRRFQRRDEQAARPGRQCRRHQALVAIA
jgi:hypothetical protein